MRFFFIWIFMVILVIEKVDAQMHRMLIGNMIFDPAADTLLQMKDTLNSDYSQNALFFADGSLALYASDGRIYDKNGDKVTSFIFGEEYCDDVTGKSRSRGTGYSEFIFVKVPHTLNQFYAIANFSRNNNNIKVNSILYYQKLKYNGLGWEIMPSFNQCFYPTTISFENCDSFLTECKNDTIVKENLNKQPNSSILREGEYDSSNMANILDDKPRYYSAYMEVSKEQTNGKRYLFTSMNECFHVFEIDSSGIFISSNVTNAINPLFISSQCDREWKDYVYDTTNGITSNFIADLDIFNGYYNNYNSTGFRGEMDLIQVSDYQIRLAIPFFNVAYNYINSANGKMNYQDFSVTGVNVFYFSVTNGIPIFMKEEVVGIDTIFRNNDSHRKIRVVKGIEFSDTGRYMYVSSVKVDFQSNYPGGQRTIIDTSPILHVFTHDDNTNCYPSWRSNITALTPKITSNFNTTNKVDVNCNFDAEKIGSYGLKDSIQFGFGQIERDYQNRLILTSEIELRVLNNINDPKSGFSKINFPVAGPVYRNLVTAHSKKLYNTFQNMPYYGNFKLNRFTYLLPDQITGENYINWFSPVINLYPDTLIIYPCTIFPTQYTNTPHLINLYRGNQLSDSSVMFDSLQFTSPVPPPLNSLGNYWQWSMNPTIMLDGPVNKAIITHLKDNGNFSAGKEKMIIYDLRHPVYSNYNYSLSITQVTTTTSNYVLTKFDWDISNNVYKIPDFILPEVSQEFRVYSIDPNTQTRLTLENTILYQNYSVSGSFFIQNSGSYEIEYSVCFSSCVSSIPNCNVKSIFINIP